MENKITVIVQVYNEELSIQECLESARLLTDDILVVDTESTDKTAPLAKKAGATVLTFPHEKYVEPARQFGIEKATSDWIFILDADERITPELAAEIKKTIDTTDHSYFKVPRQNIFGKKQLLKHGGWWPDYQLRLIKKKDFVTWPARIHATPEIKATEGKLEQPFLHYFHGDLEQMVNKTIIYEEIESDLLFKGNKSASTLTFFRKFAGELYRRLLKNQGFADGDLGIIESIYQAFSKTITYLFLYEKKNSRSL